MGEDRDVLGLIFDAGSTGLETASITGSVPKPTLQLSFAGNEEERLSHNYPRANRSGSDGG